MTTPATPETQELAELAKTRSAACKKAVAETKSGSHAAPLVMAAWLLLTASKVQISWT
ncbi:MAG: hypothetical protein WA821_13330 [Anaerolineales bacterium]